RRNTVHGNPPLRDLSRERLTRSDEGALGSAIVHLASIPHDGGERREGNDPPPLFCLNHRETERFYDVIEPMHIGVDDLVPLRITHGGEGRVGVHGSGAYYPEVRATIEDVSLKG